MVGSGVLLCPAVVCDGFVDEVPVRVQTHVHADHMEYFDRSKGFQDIYCLNATRDLLVASGDPALAHRQNLLGVAPFDAFEVEGFRVELPPSGHILGAAQVRVEWPDGYVTGYSGDFTWPLDRVIEVDELVIDSTYGSPASFRGFAPADAEKAFVELFLEAQNRGPVVVKALRGLLPRVLQLIADHLRIPLYLTDPHNRDCAVYEQHGYAIPERTAVARSQIDRLVSNERCCVATSLNHQPAAEGDDGECSILVVRKAWTRKEPVLQVSDRVWHVGISDHADFEGTVEYVRASGAQLVLTDNQRGPHGLELAHEIAYRLGIACMPCPVEETALWGHGG